MSELDKIVAYITAQFSSLFLSVFAWYAWVRGFPPKTLKGREKVMLTLSKIQVLNHNSRIYTFALPDPTHVLGLPIGQHISLSAEIDGKPVSRAYTPISSDVDLGELRMVIKVYHDGEMTQHVDKMSVGDSLAFSGPKGEFQYLGNGKFSLAKRGKITTRTINTFVGLAGGSGLTPLLQIMQAIHRDPSDKTKFHMIYGNVAEEDILMREMMEQIAKDRPGQITVWNTLDKPPKDWKEGSGYITDTMMAERFGTSPADQFALMCGPPPMLKFACKPNLEKLGYKTDDTFCF